MTLGDLAVVAGVPLILVCVALAAVKVRERRRKARRATFLRERDYEDHAAGEGRRNHEGNLSKE
jgi:hypothetical protein